MLSLKLTDSDEKRSLRSRRGRSDKRRISLPEKLRKTSCFCRNYNKREKPPKRRKKSLATRARSSSGCRRSCSKTRKTSSSEKNDSPERKRRGRQSNRD